MLLNKQRQNIIQKLLDIQKRPENKPLAEAKLFRSIMACLTWDYYAGEIMAFFNRQINTAIRIPCKVDHNPI